MPSTKKEQKPTPLKQKGRYSAEFWEQIFLKYCEGDYLDDLAKQYNIFETTLRKKALEDEWDKKRSNMKSSGLLNRAATRVENKLVDKAMANYSEAFTADILDRLALRQLGNKTYTNILNTMNKYISRVDDILEEQKDTPTKGLIINVGNKLVKTGEFFRDIASICNAINPLLTDKIDKDDADQTNDGITPPQINIQLVQMEKKIRGVEDAIDI